MKKKESEMDVTIDSSKRKYAIRGMSDGRGHRLYVGDRVTFYADDGDSPHVQPFSIEEDGTIVKLKKKEGDYSCYFFRSDNGKILIDLGMDNGQDLEKIYSWDYKTLTKQEIIEKEEIEYKQLKQNYNDSLSWGYKSDEEIIDYLKVVYDTFGEPPTTFDFIKDGLLQEYVDCCRGYFTVSIMMSGFKLKYYKKGYRIRSVGTNVIALEYIKSKNENKDVIFIGFINCHNDEYINEVRKSITNLNVNMTDEFFEMVLLDSKWHNFGEELDKKLEKAKSEYLENQKKESE